MAYMWWDWDQDRQLRELVFDFTIHNDPGNFSARNGLYLMVCFSSISNQDFYFGLQTDVSDLTRGFGRGKGLIFSRWGERDLSLTKAVGGDEGWSESSGSECDFISVRRTYDWKVGDYRMRLSGDGTEDDGEWFRVWITNLYTGDTTWVGALKFPLVDGTAMVMPRAYTTLEIYGEPIRPIDVPEWFVSVKRPLRNGTKSEWGTPGYSGLGGAIVNSDVQYDREADAVHFRVGGTTERIGPAERIEFR